MNDEYIKKIIAIEEKHFRKYPKRKMSGKEFNELFEIK
jgi:hypothetical protein